MNYEDDTMTIYERTALNIKWYMNKLENNISFKTNYSNMTAFEYIVDKTKLSPKRLTNIISGKARTRIDELYVIASALDVKIDDILIKDTKHIDS